jgi:ribosomal protein S18 acetylase RimI-like enzyme
MPKSSLSGAASPAIAFRRLGVDDLQQVFLWLLQPHVARGYAPVPSSFMEVVAKYGPRTQPENVVKAYVFSVDGGDAGYIQAYDLAHFPDYAAQIGGAAGMACVDLFIGEERLTGWGLGSRVLREFVDQVVFAMDGVTACVAGPAEGNRASIRAFEKAGFARWKLVRPAAGETECVMRREREGVYRMEPIRLDRDAAACIEFRRDAYVATFGSTEGMEEEMGAGNASYLAQLRARIAQVPEGNAHLWHGDRIVGQTEMRLIEGEPGVGYVNLFYVVPEFRGRGLGRVLHDHAASVFRALGRDALRLSVSIQNTAAIAFYRKLGWVVVGTRPNREPMQIMEFRL